MKTAKQKRQSFVKEAKKRKNRENKSFFYDFLRRATLASR